MLTMLLVKGGRTGGGGYIFTYRGDKAFDLFVPKEEGGGERQGSMFS